MKELKMYLNNNLSCKCGKNHMCDIDEIIIEDGAILRLPEVLARYDYHNICVVSDINTEEAAGEKVKYALSSAGYKYNSIVFPNKELIPDEQAVGSLLIDLPLGCELIIAVGTGTINDLCRFVSKKVGIPYYIVATAASMDGFASNVAPLIVRNLKTTYEIGKPKVIIGDLEVLSKSPLEMSAAGIGDILGKYVCLMDWNISRIVTGEYYCEYVVGLINDSINAVVNGVDGAVKGDKEAIKSVMEGLVLSGIAMSYVGNSRPASGSEHHLSHYWEMMSLFNGSHGALHGTKVAIGTVLALTIYKKLPQYLNQINDENKFEKFEEEVWNEKINKAYLKAAPQVINLENSVHKNADQNVLKRRKALKEHTKEIEGLIEMLPEPKEITNILNKMNAPYLPNQIGVTNEQLKNSVLYAKDLRNRFGLLQILFDLGISEEMSDFIVSEFPCNK